MIHRVSSQVLTPLFLRAHLRAAAASNKLGALTVHLAAALLRYCLSDLEDDDPALSDELSGVALLPTRAGGLAVITSPGSGAGRDTCAPVFLAAEADELLLEAAPQLLIDQGAAGPELTARCTQSSPVAAPAVLPAFPKRNHQWPRFAYRCLGRRSTTRWWSAVGGEKLFSR